ncbi:MAG TPA: hypothetical protein VMR21_12185 [Vicinamibacteria bacterium]|nr:hypothetical protein [Vicinamibacteria bacterium]
MLAVFGGTLARGDAALLGSPGSDMLMQFLPWRSFGFAQMARGNLALWNPHVFAGRPFLGDFQSALLYPPNLVHLVLPPRMAINVTLVFHVWLAGVLTLAWARRQELGRPAATLAGVVAMFGGPAFLHVEAGHLPHVCAIAWTPGVLLCLDEAMGRPGRAGGRRRVPWLLAAMAAAALQMLAGHPQYAYYTALVSLLFALAAVVVPGLVPAAAEGPRRRAWPLVAWALAWCGGAALAAAQLGAGVEAALESGRWEDTSAAFSASFSVPLENLPTLVAAHVLGGGTGPYFGRWYAWEVTLFVGGATLAAAAFARGRRAAVEGAIAAAALVAAFGSELPTFDLVSGPVTGFGVFRAPARMASVALPLIGLLAARGLERMRDQRPGARAPVAVALVAASMAALAWWVGTVAWEGLLARMAAAELRQVPAPVLLSPAFAESARAHTVRQLVLSAGVFAACAALLWLARRRPAAVYGLALVAAIELTTFARAHRSSSPPVMPYPATWREAAQEAGEDRVRHTRGWYGNQGMIRGHLDVWGYDGNAASTRYIALLQAIDEAAEQEGEDAQRLRGVVSMLRWRYIFGVNPQGQAALVALGETLPRAVLVEEAAVVTDRATALRTMLDAGFDPRRHVLLERAPDPFPEAGGAAGTVHVVAEDTDWIELEVEAPRPAVLVLTDSFARGWRAVPMGRPAQPRYDVLPANVALRAVPLAAGRHRLRLEYAPAGFRAGRIVSVLALLGVVVAAIQARAR